MHVGSNGGDPRTYKKVPDDNNTNMNCPMNSNSRASASNDTYTTMTNDMNAPTQQNSLTSTSYSASNLSDDSKSSDNQSNNLTTTSRQFV